MYLKISYFSRLKWDKKQMMGNERPYIEYGKGIWSMTDFDLVEAANQVIF